MAGAWAAVLAPRRSELPHLEDGAPGRSAETGQGEGRVSRTPSSLKNGLSK